MIDFLLRAKRATYAGKGAEAAPSRPRSHDLIYKEDLLLYIDTYLGSDRFAGEEAVWANGTPVWAMNYAGRVIGEPFSGDFLKLALLSGSRELPYRGAEMFAGVGRSPTSFGAAGQSPALNDGDYTYVCGAAGDFDWFEGSESIFYKSKKVYECRFHGGKII